MFMELQRQTGKIKVRLKPMKTQLEISPFSTAKNQ